MGESGRVGDGLVFLRKRLVKNQSDSLSDRLFTSDGPLHHGKGENQKRKTLDVEGIAQSRPRDGKEIFLRRE